MKALKDIYVKRKNEIFARHILATRRQDSHESIDQFFQSLKILANDCNFIAVSAIQNKEDSIRDAFINGLNSNSIRQRLLENDSLELDTAYKLLNHFMLLLHRLLMQLYLLVSL